MKNLFIIFFILLTSAIKCQVIGQWLSDKALSECDTKDTITLTKTKFKADFFQWGKPAFGVQFDKDGSFSEFYTVMCSTESSPLVHADEKWEIDSKNYFKILGPTRNLLLKIISKKGKKMRMVVVMRVGTIN